MKQQNRLNSHRISLLTRLLRIILSAYQDWKHSHHSPLRLTHLDVEQVWVPGLIGLEPRSFSFSHTQQRTSGIDREQTTFTAEYEVSYSGIV